VGHRSVCCDAHYVVSQSMIVTLHTDIWKSSVENHFVILDMNGNLLLGISLKELFPKMIVFFELCWVVFGCCL
jgi:hypothetical protein